MLKRLACIGLGMMIAITLGGCGKENKLNEYDKETNVNIASTEIEEHDELSILVKALKDKEWINENVTMREETFYSEHLNNQEHKIVNKQILSFIKLKDKNKVIVRAYSQPTAYELSQKYCDSFEQYFLVEVVGNKAVAKNYWHSVPGDVVTSKVYFDVENNLVKETIENFRVSNEYFYYIDNCDFNIENAISMNGNGDYNAEGKYETITDGIEIKEFNETQFIPLTDKNIDKYLAKTTKKQGINFIQFDTAFYPIGDLALEWRDSYKIKNYKDFEYDLDGDGEIDKITIRAKEEQLWNGELNTVHIYELNGNKFDNVGNFGKIYIVDLNKNDNSIEVVTWDNGPSDDSVYNIYSKQGGKMECILKEWTESMYADQLGKILSSGHYNPSIYKQYYNFALGNLETIDLDMNKISSVKFDATGMYFSATRENISNVCSKYYEIGETSSYNDAFEKALKECNVEKLGGGTFKILEIEDEEFYIVYVQLEDGRKGYIEEYIQLAG